MENQGKKLKYKRGNVDRLDSEFRKLVLDIFVGINLVMKVGLQHIVCSSRFRQLSEENCLRFLLFQFQQRVREVCHG